MSKYIILGISLVFSLAAQVNLKLTAPQLPTSLLDLQSLGLFRGFVLVGRVAFFSGISLLFSWLAYKKFGFLEFLIGTTLFYPLAAIVGALFFHEAYKWNHFLATILVILALFTYNFELLTTK